MTKRFILALTMSAVACTSLWASTVSIILTNADTSLLVPWPTGTESYRLGFSINADPSVFGFTEFSLTNHVQQTVGGISWSALGDTNSTPGSAAISAEVFREGAEIGASLVYTNANQSLWVVPRRSGPSGLTGAQQGTNNYLGIVLLDMTNAPHYGFVQYQLIGALDASGLAIIGGEINTEPYVPVTAGVPEPSTYALLLMTGASGYWLARRRR
jgi:hypothetical protein